MGGGRTLPPLQRAAVVHRYVLDLPYAEVAEASATSEDAARANAYEGRKKLRAALRRHRMKTNIDAALRRAGFEEASLTAAAATALEAARRRGLLDVAYTTVDTPFGPLFVASTGKGLVRLAYPKEPFDHVLEELAESVSPRCSRTAKRTDDLRRQLEEYFEGRAPPVRHADRLVAHDGVLHARAARRRRRCRSAR